MRAVALAAVLALLVAAPAAHAASAGISGGQLVYEADAFEANVVTIALDGTVYRVTDSAPLVAAAGCTQDGADVVCDAAAVTSIGAALLDGDDEITIDAAIPAQVLGYAGNDTVVGGDADDELLGMDGADTVLGRGGNDRMLELDDLHNHLDGGPGADSSGGGAQRGL